MPANASSVGGQPFSKLGDLEKRVLLLLSEGISDAEIGRTVFLGEGTIRNYVHSIFSKLGVASRDEAAAYAAEHDLRGHLGSEN